MAWVIFFEAYRAPQKEIADMRPLVVIYLPWAEGRQQQVIGRWVAGKTLPFSSTGRGADGLFRAALRPIRGRSLCQPLR